MPRFFIDASDIKNDMIVITGDDAKHISKVLRMRVGEKIELCDCRGTDYIAEICYIGRPNVEARILERRHCISEPKIHTRIIQALPKASKMEYIIQKCTELGVCEIIPCIMERCVVKLDSKEDGFKKTERWRGIALAAAKQSGRGIIPAISEPVSFDEAIELLKDSSLAFAAYENETDASLKTVLRNAYSPGVVTFLIGPEGGISENEIKAIRDNNIATVSIGKRILRTETAGEAILSMVMYEYEI